MKRIVVLAFTGAVAFGLAACNKQKEADSAEVEDAVDEDGPMEEAGEWTDQAAEDTGEAVEEAAEETSDELDGDPTTD